MHLHLYYSSLLQMRRTNTNVYWSPLRGHPFSIWFWFIAMVPAIGEFLNIFCCFVVSKKHQKQSGFLAPTPVYSLKRYRHHPSTMTSPKSTYNYVFKRSKSKWKKHKVYQVIHLLPHWTARRSKTHFSYSFFLSGWWCWSHTRLPLDQCIFGHLSPLRHYHSIICIIIHLHTAPTAEMSNLTFKSCFSLISSLAAAAAIYEAKRELCGM